jgi:hypothetical protein
MSRLSNMTYGSLEDVQRLLNEGEHVDLNETQAALINAIQVIRRLETAVQRLEANSRTYGDPA